MADQEYKYEKLLTEIDNKSKAVINMGKQLHAITPKMQVFDFLIIPVLNRTVNLNKGFTTLMRQNNFIAAAPLVRINMDSLLRLYAPRISEYDINTFSSKVLAGEHIRKMKHHNGKDKLTDSFLVEKLSEIEGMEWIKSIYEAGNSFVHFGDGIIFSSQRVADEQQRTVNVTVGFHDTFIPDSEKEGAIIWMSLITDSIVQQVQIWMYEKAKAEGFDIKKLNEVR